MKNKKNLGNDYTEKITSNFIEDMVDSHIECWKDRYSKYSTKKKVRFDLNVNHDPSLEIEMVEIELGRELSIDENNHLIDTFNKRVVRKINLKTLKPY